MRPPKKRAWARMATLLAALTLSAPATIGQVGCTGDWTADVSPRNGVARFPTLGGFIRALQAFDDGSGTMLFAGGHFELAGGASSQGAARWTGSKWLAASIPTDIRDFVIHDTGSGPKLYAAHQTGVLRWTGSGWTAVGSATGGPVRRLEVFDAGSGPVLVAAGSFTAMNGVAASNIATWNGATWSALGAGTNGSVYALRAWNDGTGPALYVGGTFSSAGVVAASEVAKWASGIWSALGAGFTGPGSSAVVAFEVFDDGTGPHLYAGGDFTHSAGQPRNGIAKWDAGAWSPLGTGVTGSSANVSVGVYSLHVFDPDGAGGVPAKLVTAGPFAQAGGLPARLCAAWDGVSWSPTSATGFEGGSAIWDLQSIPVPGGSVLVCGGDFTGVNGFSASTIAQWNGSSWSPVGGGFCQPTPVGFPPPTGVNAMAVHDDGSGPAVFAGGYVSIAGALVGSYVAKWDGTSVAPLGGLFDGAIETLAAIDDGSGPKLFAGGNFLTVGGVVTGFLVFWSGSAWTALGQIPSGAVYALTVFDDGTGPAIYAGGVWGIWRWNGSAWIAVPGSPLNVRALTVWDPDGFGPIPPRLVAGFEVVSFAAMSGIGVWDGASWTNLGVGVGPTGSIVERIVVADIGTGPSLFVGGWFDYAGGLPANGIARWSGTSWSTLAAGVGEIGAGGKVDDLVVCDGPGGAALYVCGEFNTPAYNIARWNGSSFQPLGTGLDERGRAILGFDDGTGPAVIVGGRFFRAGDRSSHYLARWGCALPTVAGIQSGGPGSPLSLTNSNLTPGHEYFNIFSAEVCGTGPGAGPYLGLCASDPSFLLWQFALPVGTAPIHFVAPSSTAQFGPFTVPPLTLDVVCFDWTGGTLGLYSSVTRLLIQ